MIDINKVFSTLGIEKCIDFRRFYSSKMIYTIEFFNNYANFISPVIISSQGKSKKALILDCDNTLWRGVLGEEGFDGIEMSPDTKDGAIFHEVQELILNLEKKGVIWVLSF